MKKEKKDMSSATLAPATRKTAAKTYMNIDQCAELIGASRTSIKTAAHKHRIGIFVGDKLVAISPTDAKKIRSKINKRCGNPNFVK